MNEQTTLDSYPEWRAANAKLQDVYAGIAELERLVNDRHTALTGQSPDEERAATFLESGEIVARSDTTAARHELDQLYDELGVKRRAVKLQEKVVSDLRSRLSAEICERLAEPHRDLVNRLATALIELGKVAVEEMEFRDRLFQGSVMFSGYLRPMPTALGDPRERDSRLSFWLLDALEHRLIERKLIPAAWLKRWGI